MVQNFVKTLSESRARCVSVAHVLPWYLVHSYVDPLQPSERKNSSVPGVLLYIVWAPLRLGQEKQSIRSDDCNLGNTTQPGLVEKGRCPKPNGNDAGRVRRAA